MPETRDGYTWVPWKEWLDASSGVVNPRRGISLPAPYLVEHHTPGLDPATYEAAVNALNSIWYYHTFVAEGGWGWIGYNTIGWGRYIFEGAGLGNRGIHAPGANDKSHGHAFLLDSGLRQPTQDEWSALRALCGDLVKWGYLNRNVLIPNSEYNTVHHDWVATACAGPGVDASAHKFYTPLTPTPEPEPEPEPELSLNIITPTNPWRTDGDTAPWVRDFNFLPKGTKVIVRITGDQNGNYVPPAGNTFNAQILGAGGVQDTKPANFEPAVLTTTADGRISIYVPKNVIKEWVSIEAWLVS